MRRDMRAEHGRLRIGDVIWGSVLGLIGISIALLVVMLIRGSPAGQSDPCASTLAPLGTVTVDQAEMEFAIAGLERTSQMAMAGNVQGAEQAFFGRVHNLTHNLDTVLRPRDEVLGRQLCQATLALETEFSGARRPQEIARLSQELVRIIRQAMPLVPSG
jgi:hypothetical protein